MSPLHCVMKVAQLSGWVSYGQKWNAGNGRQHFTDIIGPSLTIMT